MSNSLTDTTMSDASNSAAGTIAVSEILDALPGFLPSVLYHAPLPHAASSGNLRYLVYDLQHLARTSESESANPTNTDLTGLVNTWFDKEAFNERYLRVCQAISSAEKDAHSYRAFSFLAKLVRLNQPPSIHDAKDAGWEVVEAGDGDDAVPSVPTITDADVEAYASIQLESITGLAKRWNEICDKVKDTEVGQILQCPAPPTAVPNSTQDPRGTIADTTNWLDGTQRSISRLEDSIKNSLRPHSTYVSEESAGLSSASIRSTYVIDQPGTNIGSTLHAHNNNIRIDDMRQKMDKLAKHFSVDSHRYPYDTWPSDRQ